MQEKKLEMYGGLFGGLIPLIVLVGGLVWLSVAERGGTKPFWACAWIALCVGIFFAKNKEEYCKAAMRGIGDRTGIVIVTAWLLAGVFGKLMAAGGLVQGLLWMGMTTGAQGGVFVVLVFLAAMLFALGTGTSTGTCIALSPVLYPAGYFLGADPAMLGLAILSGAAFGDNLAPISDTTIVSAYTRGRNARRGAQPFPAGHFSGVHFRRGVPCVRRRRRSAAPSRNAGQPEPVRLVHAFGAWDCRRLGAQGAAHH